MENAFVRFPFIHLPFPVQQRVVRNMDSISQLVFSTLSKKSASILKSLKIRIHVADLSITESNDIKMTLLLRVNFLFTVTLCFGYGEESNGGQKSVERTPECVRLMADYARRLPMQEVTIRCHLTLRYWIYHLLNIYDRFFIRSIVFSNRSDVYDLPSIKTALRGVEPSIISFQGMDNEELFKKVTMVFLPIKRLGIDYPFTEDLSYRPQDSGHLQRILLSNFDFFGVIAMQNPYYGSVDRLLAINASTIKIENPVMSELTLNRFLKLWTKGAMPRLRRMQISFDQSRTMKKDLLLIGVRYAETGRDQEQSATFELYNGPQTLVVKGDLSILRYDGMEATITLEEREDNVTVFEFCVWSE